MVQFSKLKITGFKSFVDPTELWIENGLTGIVGPNGCGKSNLVEALRWVMGEGSAKRMRGKGMEDMIFSGSASRPARNIAEVQLQLEDGGSQWFGFTMRAGTDGATHRKMFAQLRRALRQGRRIHLEYDRWSHRFNSIVRVREADPPRQRVQVIQTLMPIRWNP